MPTSASAFWNDWTKKSKYLKTKSTPRLKMTAAATKALRPRGSAVRCTATASTWFTSVEAASRKQKRQSHQP